MADKYIIEEQHPIPQQISAFQFHLVGDMTLKQFVQLAAGALIALLIYASGLPNAIRWPLILFSFGGGAALAFLPLEDRPLGQWIVSFFKSIYSPTIFVWQKAASIPQYFAPETESPAKPAAAAPTAQVKSQVAPPAKVVQTEEAKLDQGEQTFLEKLTTMSDTHPEPSVISTVPSVAPAITPAKTEPSAKKVQRDLSVPLTEAVAVEPKEDSGFAMPQEETPTAQPSAPSPIVPVMVKGRELTGKQAKFSQDAAPPTPPTKPNTVVGQVMDPDGKIVEGAILEIKDPRGRPARALKTNMLGHFMIVTPLLDGRYEILAEKEGLVFEPVTFSAKGAIIPPISIWAKQRVES